MSSKVRIAFIVWMVKGRSMHLYYLKTKFILTPLLQKEKRGQTASLSDRSGLWPSLLHYFCPEPFILRQNPQEIGARGQSFKGNAGF